MASDDRASYHLAVLLQATLPGAPCTYYGDEVGVVGGIDPDSRRAFPWDASSWENELLAFVRAAFALRRGERALRSDGVNVLTTSGAALAFERATDGRRLVVAINPGAEAVSLSTAAVSGNVPTILLATGRAGAEPARIATADGSLTIAIGPRAGVVVAAA
jgi:glycosidase